MKCLLILLTILAGTTAARGQLADYDASGKGWTKYSDLSSPGLSRASLRYVVNERDTTFLLLMWDQRPQIQNYFSVTFRNEGNTISSLYAILLSFFEKENRRNKEYFRVFQLGDEKVSVYRSGVIDVVAIVFSTDKGKIMFTKKEVEKLFGRK